MNYQLPQWFKKYIVILGALLISLSLLLGCTNEKGSLASSTENTTSHTSQQSISGNVTIRVLDIGQGDAILLKVGKTYSMIDTGDIEHRPHIVALLKKYGVTELENVIITHPHADHLGGFYAIAKEFPIHHVYDNGLDIESGTYRTYKKIIDAKKMSRHVLYKGDVLDLGNGAYFEVFAPWKNDVLADKHGKINHNNNSIVGRFVFGKFSMMFTGDAEKEEELRLVKEQNTKMSSKVLKVSHHGSNGSSEKDFIRSIRPEIAVISNGLHNSYGHPGEKAMERLRNEQVSIYRTDTMGTITIRTNGKDYEVSTER